MLFQNRLQSSYSVGHVGIVSPDVVEPGMYRLLLVPQENQNPPSTSLEMEQGGLPSCVALV